MAGIITVTKGVGKYLCPAVDLKWLWPGVVVPVRVPSIGQIDVSILYIHINIFCVVLNKEFLLLI